MLKVIISLYIKIVSLIKLPVNGFFLLLGYFDIGTHSLNSISSQLCLEY